MATGLDFNTPIAPPLRLRRFSVQQYWIVNVVEKCIECYTFESGSMVPKPAIVPANSKASITIGESVIEIDPQPLLG